LSREKLGDLLRKRKREKTSVFVGSVLLTSQVKTMRGKGAKLWQKKTVSPW
jgi:hypothetical protein